ncbi:hypothetical protein PG991_013262 [Apiospora marii]|uniref:Uncharacterized protein n=1 Tax=Apiospora marii TaxID=335849 RepID=A0ABR1R5H5_9PEZI
MQSARTIQSQSSSPTVPTTATPAVQRSDLNYFYSTAPATTGQFRTNSPIQLSLPHLPFQGKATQTSRLESFRDQRPDQKEKKRAKTWTLSSTALALSSPPVAQCPVPEPSAQSPEPREPQQQRYAPLPIHQTWSQCACLVSQADPTSYMT